MSWAYLRPRVQLPASIIFFVIFSHFLETQLLTYLPLIQFLSQHNDYITLMWLIQCTIVLEAFACTVRVQACLHIVFSLSFGGINLALPDTSDQRHFGCRTFRTHKCGDISDPKVWDLGPIWMNLNTVRAFQNSRHCWPCVVVQNFTRQEYDIGTTKLTITTRNAHKNVIMLLLTIFVNNPVQESIISTES